VNKDAKPHDPHNPRKAAFRGRLRPGRQSLRSAAVIEAEADGVRLRIPSNASRDAIMAVMEGLAVLKRRR